MEPSKTLADSESLDNAQPDKDGIVVESNRDADPAPEPEKETEEPAAEAKSEDEAPADAEPEEEEAQAEPEPEPAPEPRRKSRTQARFDKLTERRKEAEAQAADAKREAERLRERLKKYETPKPQETDFDSLDEYQAALAAYNVQQFGKQEREEDAEYAEQRAQDATQAANRMALHTFNERAADFAKSVPDYYEVTQDDAVAISEATALQLLKSEKGPQIAYYLGKHKAEALALSMLDDPVDVARELGRLEGRLTAPPPKRVTSAPQPVEAIATGATGSSKEFDPSTASVDEMEAYLREKNPNLFG